MCVEAAGVGPVDADGGRASYAGGRRLPRPHQTAAHQIRGEGAEEDPQEDQK